MWQSTGSGLLLVGRKKLLNFGRRIHGKVRLLLCVDGRLSYSGEQIYFSGGQVFPSSQLTLRYEEGVRFYGSKSNFKSLRSCVATQEPFLWALCNP